MSYFHLNFILKGKLTVCCLLMLLAVPLNAQREAKQIGDFKESISLNEHLRGTKRTLQYRPDGDEFVCVMVRIGIPVLCTVVTVPFG